MYIVAFDDKSPYKDLQSAIDGMKEWLDDGEQTLLVWIYNGRPLYRYIATKRKTFIELQLLEPRNMFSKITV